MNECNIQPITWDIDVPLLTNRHVLSAMLKVILGAGALTGALVSLLLAIQGDWKHIPALLAVFLAISAGLFLLAVLVMWIFFRNHMQMRFTVDSQGVCSLTTDRMARFGNRSALLLGLLAGRPGVAGSGALAMAQEQQMLHWDAVADVAFDPVRHCLAFRNRWRVLMRVYCSPENYETVCALVTASLIANPTERPGSRRSPLGWYLLRTALVVLACLPVFALGDVYGYGLLLPLLLLCFSLAMVWLIRHLAWVAGALAILTVASAISNALSVRQTTFFGVKSYFRYEVLSGDNWALSVLAGLGVCYLLWLATQILRRRIQPVLEADWTDGSGT